ncbi:MAG TPA: hypothetical protein VGR81_14675 [Candidatus Acidoferrales bacterium]|nr:hypothetical protein [Candidatus Acidoferrales bacterium]
MPNVSESGSLMPDKGRRRSLRVMLSVTLIVRGKGSDGKEFSEETKSLVVNAHGALIQLRSEVKADQKVTMMHKGTNETQDCRIVYVGAMQGGKAQVGIEFAKPSPQFWQISFPPEDWNAVED